MSRSVRNQLPTAPDPESAYVDDPDTYTDAYAEGQVDYDNGWSLADNRYRRRNSDKARQWRKGWEDALIEDRTEDES
jgi:hypothetical protein